MAQTAAIVSALKNALKEQGITYQQVAEALDLSEASVKRLFSERQFSLQRLDQICSLLGLEISDLVRRLDQAQRIDALTAEQEQELVGDDRLLLVAICALNRWSLAQILETYQLSEVEAVGRLARLDRMGLIELLPGNRIKPLISHDFRWQQHGPIQRFFEQQVQADFFQCHFNLPGELRLFLSGMLSPQSTEQMHQKLQRLAQAFRHSHQEDLVLPLEQRFGVSMILAIRPWEVAAFQQLRRPEAAKYYPGHKLTGEAG
ncbi:MAG TPA: transcriptional regulator [Pseudomonas sp.]|jgi:transcriptional regulator with XRE-family HTH domain|nr:transcriptional regulator [Pseudomonadales bacterium]MAQ53151.1 transcriptional regulator [Pseudomonas sp.]MBB51546.1 transcriptional regulator [Pseudomonadales bacterium]HCA24442.1 transcriptional regulator [Pseudomonas sp.]|tara:strand:+ start:894 stop:1673 length:780 start_codon:yes stop_codon:yes gene_type:complete